MLWRSALIITAILALLTLGSGCSSTGNENNLVRREVLDEILDSYQVDDLIIRLESGEIRENFGFQGTTVYLVGPVREKEYWEVRDPARSYILIGDILYSTERTQATVSVETYLGENSLQRFEILLSKRSGTWQVVGKKEV